MSELLPCLFYTTIATITLTLLTASAYSASQSELDIRAVVVDPYQVSEQEAREICTLYPEAQKCIEWLEGHEEEDTVYE